MATIIQIKRGTGSAVPSGLADGELAINLDNGKLFFGSGSNSVNDFTFTSLNATSLNVTNITSSIVTSSIVLSEGSNTFGDELTDTQTFNGHITASANISASGNLLGGGITINGNSHFNSSVIDLGVNDSDRINLNGEIITSATFLSNITSSGNISSSGTVTANSFTGNGLSIDGSSNAHIEVGEYNVGFDVVALNTIFITGSGLIISGAMADTNHHNMLKIGNVELLDLNTAISPNEFLIHNVNSFKITSGSDGGDAGNSGRLFEHNGTDFTLFKNNAAAIAVTSNTTTLTNNNIQFVGSTFIKADIESPGANGYFLFAASDPHLSPTITKAVKTDNVFQSLTGNVTASAISASGTITAAAAVLTTADINGGTIDGITSLTAGGNLDIGAHDLRAATLTADGLTSGRVVFAGTAGVLSDDADLTFATDTLTVTKIANVNSTSHITASGNISASGTIIGSNLSGTNTGDQSLVHLAVTGSDVIFGNITASGNISASGNIIAVSMSAAALSGDGSGITNVSATANAGTYSSSLQILGNITSSGNISSSGTIIAATLDAAAVTDTLAAAIVAEIDNDEIPIAKLAEDAVTVTAGTGLTGGGSITLGGSATVNVIGGTGVTANANDIAIGQDVATTANVQFANITSSANISSSGDIKANTFTAVGNVDFDGDLDVDGTANLDIVDIDGAVDMASTLTVDGTVDIAGELQHSGDADTKISFNTNQIALKAGNTSVFESTITGSKLTNVHQNIYNTDSLALSGNGGAIGDIVKFGGITTIAGAIYALTGSDWSLASATSTATGATSSLAVALGTNPSSDGMCLRGFVNPAVDPSAPLGNPIFLNTTVGRMVKTAPASSNNVVRIVGYQYGTDLVYFNPSNDYIIHA